VALKGKSELMLTVTLIPEIITLSPHFNILGRNVRHMASFTNDLSSDLANNPPILGA